MTCPYLTYRDGDASRSFEVPRAYCTVVEEFVQPMRADVCNDRYGLDHATDCEYYLAAEGDDGRSESHVEDESDGTSGSDVEDESIDRSDGTDDTPTDG